MCKFRNYDNYEIYADGRIWSYYTNKFLKPQTNGKGYQQVWLYDNAGNAKLYLVHRIVYESVTGNQIPIGMQVNHIDENKANNALSNLNLMTPKENTNYGTGIERCAKARSKQVVAFKDGELVMSFKNIMDADKNGYSFGCVARCCRGERKTYKGYTWKYI